MPNLTAHAQNDLGPFVEKATKTQLVVIVQNVFEEQDTVTITPDDLAQYYATEGHSTSGCRTLAGHTGDWRKIDHLASIALEWFKRVNRSAMRIAGRRHGLEAKF